MPKFDARKNSDVSIDVRQNELVVATSEVMAEVAFMFTAGLSPCVGMVLWCPSMCAVGHFHGWDTMEQTGVVIARFADVSEAHRGSRKCVLVRAIGNPILGAAWHSERMVSELRDRLTAAELPHDEVRPAPETQSAKMCVELATGELEYAFTPSGAGNLRTRTSLCGGELPDWVKRPHAADHLVIGVCRHGDADMEIAYRRGHETELVRLLLA